MTYLLIYKYVMDDFTLGDSTIRVVGWERKLLEMFVSFMCVSIHVSVSSFLWYTSPWVPLTPDFTLKVVGWNRPEKGGLSLRNGSIDT